MKKALLIAAAITTAVITPLNSAVEARTRLSGAGASFPAKIYTRWFKDLATEGGPRVNYQAVGSGSGRKAFIDQTVNFGASDDPMKDKDIAKVTRGLAKAPFQPPAKIEFDCLAATADTGSPNERVIQHALTMFIVDLTSHHMIIQLGCCL